MSALLKKISVLFFSLVMVTAVQAKEDTPENIPGTTKVSAEDLIDLVEQHDDLVIIDARKPSDRAKGFIEGSIALPDTDTTPAALAEHIASKSTPVAFYCNGVKCGRSVKSAKIAMAEGYSNIYWFRGGWGEWTEKGYPAAE